MDYKAIADGLATRYDPANVTPPTGYTDIQLSTAQPPNNIVQVPTVIVFPTSGEMNYERTRGKVFGEHEFIVNFYYERGSGDLTRDWAALESWLGVLLSQTHAASKLGLSASGVMKAIPMRYEFGELIYGGDSYDGISITVHVWTEEAVDLVAA